MSNTKKRRDVEVYENYWKFTAAHLDITGTKFNNCLNVIVRFSVYNRYATYIATNLVILGFSRYPNVIRE